MNFVHYGAPYLSPFLRRRGWARDQSHSYIQIVGDVNPSHESLMGFTCLTRINYQSKNVENVASSTHYRVPAIINNYCKRACSYHSNQNMQNAPGKKKINQRGHVAHSQSAKLQDSGVGGAFIREADTIPKIESGCPETTVIRQAPCACAVVINHHELGRPEGSERSRQWKRY